MSLATRRAANVIWLVIAIALLAFGGYTGVKQWKLSSTGTVAEGRVMSSDPPWFSVAFRAGNKEYTVTRSRPISGVALRKGDKTEVIFLADAPEDTARLNRPVDLWTMPGLGAIGGCFALLSWFNRRKELQNTRYAMSEADVATFEPLAIMRWALAFMVLAVLGFNTIRKPPPVDPDEAAVVVVPAADENGVPYLTAENFPQLMATSPLPVIAVAWSKDCVDCPSFTPELARIRQSWAGRLALYKIDGDIDPLVKQLGVKSYPTVFVLYKSGILARNDGGFFKPVTGANGQPSLGVDEQALWAFLGQAEIRARSMKK